jgi:peptide/nickel transport system permease protein
MRRGNLPFLFACLWVVFMAFIAILAPVMAPYDPAQIDITQTLEEPSMAHWMGTDDLGRDVLSRMIYGSRVSLAVGFVAVGIATVLGVLLGALAGFYGGWYDRVIISFIDIMLCFPVFFLILACIARLEPSLTHIMVIIGITGWMGTARLVRAEILSLREREFILAARALGASHWRIITRHLLPNAMGPVLVTVVLGVANAVLIESSLSFLGIGVQPPMASWGNILTDGKQSLGVAWWLTLYPGLAILFTVLGYNLIGEMLRGRLNVRKIK